MSEETIQEDGVAVNSVGAGGMGSASPGPIQGLDRLMSLKPLKRKLPKYNFTMPENKSKKLRDIIGRDLKNERRSDRK